MKKQCDLKLVILYDPRKETYTVVEHNLEPKDAVAQAVAMRKIRLPAFTVEQTTRHRAQEAEECPDCKRDVNRNFAAWASKPERRNKPHMNDTPLKSIIVLDLETHKYKPSGHNLGAEEAVNLARAFTENGRTAKVIDQKARHRAHFHWRCKPCMEAAEKAGNVSEAPAGESESTSS
jgi:hypothetical protein